LVLRRALQIPVKDIMARFIYNVRPGMSFHSLNLKAEAGVVIEAAVREISITTVPTFERSCVWSEALSPDLEAMRSCWLRGRSGDGMRSVSDAAA
jgi:hypothetical protein